MKTTAIKILAATIVLTGTIFLTTAFKGQESSQNKYASMLTWEAEIGGSSKIIIVYEDNKTEEIELEKFKIGNFTGNTIKVNTAINNLASKGYELISSTGLDTQRAMYTFIKK
jgi:hypothetical protein